MTSTVTSTSQDSNSISPHGLYTISHFTNLTRFSRIQHIVGPEYVLLIMFRQIPLHNYCKNAFHLKWSRNRDSFSLLIYLFRLCWVFTAVQAFSLFQRAGNTLRLGCGPLISEASLVAECVLQGAWLQQLWLRGSRAQAQWLSCSEACGVFMHQGLNLCLLQWQILYTEPPDKSPESRFRRYYLSQNLEQIRGKEEKEM